jgi:phospholipase/lecithinase/hemolysin
MKTFVRSICLIICVFTYAQFSVGSARTLDRFQKVVVFGDSISDNGNSFVLTGAPAAPYFEGRWTNGFNWVDYFPKVAHHFPAITAFAKNRGTNFAVGGDTSADLATQIGTFLANFEASPRYLYVIEIGANDFAAGINPDTTAQNIYAAIGQLATAGAKEIVVLTVPDLSITPVVIGQGGQIVQAAEQFVTTANIELAKEIAVAQSTYSVHIATIDINALFVPVVKDPTDFGFENSVGEAFNPSTGKIVADPNTYVFWDGFHPTTPVHLLFARFFLFAIQNQLSAEVSASSGQATPID